MIEKEKIEELKKSIDLVALVESRVSRLSAVSGQRSAFS